MFEQTAAGGVYFAAMRLSRRQFVKSLMTAVPCGAGYAGVVEPGWLHVKRTTIQLAAAPLPRPVKLLHLSDLHFSTAVPLEHIAKAVSLGLAEKPDAICVTGDFITDQLRDEAAYARVLARLADAAPTFATMGNHDGGNWAGGHGGYPTSEEVQDLVRGAGLCVLHNHSADLAVGDSRLRITGLGDAWAGEFHPDQAFVAGGTVHGRVALSHNPDTKDALLAHPWELLLCGHTHGGQVALPFLGGGCFAPVRDSRYVDGHYGWKGRHLYVTRGVGSILGLRFNCRPEVTVLTLV